MLVQGFDMSAKEWGELPYYPLMWNTDGVKRTKATTSQKANIDLLRTRFLSCATS